MLLTAGVAVGLTLFAPRVGECLYFVIPNLALWCLLAAILTGRAHQVFGRQTPGTERYGLLLAMLWSPLGVWHLIGIYRDVL